MSVCSVWTVDEVGRQEQTEHGKDPQEGEARPPDLEQEDQTLTTNLNN